MGAFKKFLKESDDLLQQINDMLDELSDEEVSEFGEYLFDEFLEMDEESDEYFEIEDVKDMIAELGDEFYQEILDMLSPEDFGDDEETDDAEIYHDVDPEEQDAELGEGVSRIMKKGNMNRKKRKFMSNTKADMRKTKALRKKEARKTRAKRKRNYRANKVKIKAYQKSRSTAIKKGKHIVKRRRAA